MCLKRKLLLNLFTCLTLLTATLPVKQVTGFWFTDSTLFQAPLLNQLVRAEQNPTNSDNNGIANNWLRVDPPRQEPPNQQQQQQQRQQQQQLANQNVEPQATLQTKGIATNSQLALVSPINATSAAAEQCQCLNTEWLQNQTSSWLAKWMVSPIAQSQLRLLMSNSTGANGRRQQQQQQQRRDAKQHHANNNSNHWATWIRGGSGGGVAAGKGNTNTGSTNGNSSSSTAVNNGANNISLASRAVHKLRTRDEQQQLKLLQGERGPQGPKGEAGARGEPGSSGLISVRDRNALFDLPEASQQVATKQEQQRQLVFIETEQMLVIGSTSLGWRPVQLLSPLRDFRKTVSKFSLSSSDELRRRLVSVGQQQKKNIDNSISSATGAAATAAGQVTFVGASEDDADLLDEADDDDDDEDDEDDDEDNDEEDDDDMEGDDSEVDVVDREKDDAANKVESRYANGNQMNALSSSDNRSNTRRLRKKPVERKQVTNRTRAPVLLLQARSGAASPLELSSNAVAAAAAALVASAPAVEVDKPVKQMNDDADQSGAQRRHFNSQDERRRLKLRMAALNEPLSGNFHGIKGADFECKRNAARANVKGSFRAFLAAKYQNLNDVVRHNAHRYPVVNLRGETLANSWTELFKQQQQHVANPLSRVYSFDGRHVATDSHWPNKLVWHGANNKAGYRDMIHNCETWHSDSLNKFGSASPLIPPRSYNNNNQQHKHAPGFKRSSRQHKRHLNISSSNNSSLNVNQPEYSYGSALDMIEKYPCRMPLIVLCIETVAQSTELNGISTNSKSIDNSINDFGGSNNMETL